MAEAHLAQLAARAVSLRPLQGPVVDEADLLARIAQHTRELAGGSVADAVAWAPWLGDVLPEPGGGRTLLRWEAMATVAAHDLTVARVVEPHLDALAILREAGEHADPQRTWGVYAAEGPPPKLEARPGQQSGAWHLSGRKPWCSLASHVSHALVTAWVGPDARSLFAVDLAHRGVQQQDGVWAPRGLSAITSTALEMTEVPAREVGGPGWYLHRPGFAWGGIGVAAVWYGGAVGVARRLAQEVRRREPDQIALMHLGRIDAALNGARAALYEAAASVDAGEVSGAAAGLLAARTRHVVVGAAETVLREVAHGLGPGPLSQEAEHAGRVADLQLYLRQHHAERDAASSGRLVAATLDAGPPW